MDSSPPSDDTRIAKPSWLRRDHTLRGCAVVRWKDSRGEHVRKVERPSVIGSAPESNIVVADATVSRLHAQLELRNDGVWVRDLGSRNGTFVDGTMIQAARARDGARVTLGTVDMHVQYGGEQTSIELWPQNNFGPLVGRSAPMRALFAQLAKIAELESSVIIEGETGTGKELVARGLHDASPRSDNPFVVVDCAALPEALLDSELFGHAKGSFTGAAAARAGAFEAADGGTVFLDEIGELPMSMQPKLLRVLESRTVRRIGETTHRKVDIRIVSATHRDLLAMVNAGHFREDLYFRLAVVPVSVPPLRERREDIELLVDHFMQGRQGAISRELMSEIAARPWRGNVRELRNFVDRAVALGTTHALAMRQTAARRDEAEPAATGRDSAVPLEQRTVPFATSSQVAFEQPYKQFREVWLDYGEREYIVRLLERCDRNVASAAAAAGVDRTYMYRLVKKHRL